MPRKGVKHKQWDPKQMKLAVEAVKNKEMGYLKPSKVFGIPKTTIEDYVKKGASVNPIGRKPVLPKELQDDLALYCLEMDRRYYGIRGRDIRRLAFQLASKNRLPNPFSRKTELAGRKWMRNFLKSHKNLSFRTPQGISKATVKGFTPDNVNAFYDLLESSFEKVNFDPARVYNVDETGLTSVQRKHSKVISFKGKKQVAALTSADRGSLVTVVTCMSAIGSFVPPPFVFPRKNMKAELLDGTPAESIAGCHPSGWIQTNLFTQWLQHFVKFTKPSKEELIVLLLDGHYSHTRNVDIIDIVRDTGIIIVCISPHTSHKLQPLDLAFMAPLKTYYAQEIKSWLKNNPGRTITSFNICRLMCPAYQKCATAEIAANGFRKPGIYPLNRNVFKESDFLIEQQRERTSRPIEQLRERMPPLSTVRLEETAHLHTYKAESHLPFFTAADIEPLSSYQQIVRPNTTRKSRQGTTCIITSTPYKEELQKSLVERNRRKSVKNKETT
ncbi:CENP-B N-terminal DNA-binding domain [Popillia japonica]|uniref:CENP-B N-terminal DNA-binding domain n=1 Tax=Popillia japonica TaxID=7064 RepID=A0AAW1I8Z5_POPJA